MNLKNYHLHIFVNFEREHFAKFVHFELSLTQKYRLKFCLSALDDKLNAYNVQNDTQASLISGSARTDIVKLMLLLI